MATKIDQSLSAQLAPDTWGVRSNMIADALITLQEGIVTLSDHDLHKLAYAARSVEGRARDEMNNRREAKKRRAA